jgi:hypothetical protein
MGSSEMQDWRGLRVFSITLETRLFRILSPVRLPVPPPRRALRESTEAYYFALYHCRDFRFDSLADLGSLAPVYIDYLRRST